MDFKKISAIVGAVVLVLGGVIGIIYVADVPIQANVIDSDCSFAGTSEVTVRTKLPIPGIVRNVEVSNGACGTVAGMQADGEDQFVKYYPKSERTVIYDRDPDNGGSKLYDSG